MDIYYETGRPEAAQHGSADPDGLCPYPGLRPFGPEQAQWFSGRTRVTAELLERAEGRLAQAAPLFVVAPSGAGKSSLLKAGLLPAIQAGRLAAPGSARWPQLVFTPTADPLAAVAGAIAQLTGTAANRPHSPGEAGRLVTASDLAARLDAALQARALADSPAAAGRPSGSAVIVVDQFEELFTLCRNEGARQAFIEWLLLVAGGRSLVVCGLRGAYCENCASYPQLRAALQDGQLLLGPMSPDELQEAIRAPALATGLAVQGGLVELMLTDLGVSRGPAGSGPDGTGGGDEPIRSAYQAGRLPLLAHALRATWRGRDGNRLTIGAYQESGGIRDAIARSAELRYEGLSPSARLSARPVFLSLLRIGEGEESRQPVDRTDAWLAEPGPAAVIAAFTEARLLTQTDKTVQITHEALLRAWPRLRDWIKADRGEFGHLVRQDLQDAARAWVRTGRDSSVLYRGNRLANAQEWASSSASATGLGSPVTDFLAASAAMAAWGRRLRRGAVAALALLTIAALVSAAFAFVQRAVAVRQSDQAIAAALIRDSQSVGAARPGLARLLALAAWRFNASGSSWLGMLDAAALPGIRVLFSSATPVSLVAFSPDGTMVAGASGQTASVIQVWRTGDGQQVGPTLRPGVRVAALAFSPDGRVLLAGGSDGTVRQWNIASGRPAGAPFSTGADARSMAFSPGGKLLARGTGAGSIQLWNVAAAHPAGTLDQAPGDPHSPVSALAFGRDGTILASGSRSGAVRLWDIGTGQPAGPPLTVSRPGPVGSLAFSPDGEILAAGGYDGTVALRDLAHRRWIRDQAVTPAASSPSSGGRGAVTSVAFSPNGQIMASGSDSGTELWDVATGQPIEPPLTAEHPSAISSVAFSPNGRTLISGASDGVEFWDPTVAWQTGVTPARGHPQPVSSVAFSPGGMFLASGGSGGTIRFLATATGRQAGPVLTAPGGGMDTVAFSPDGRTLASASEDGTVQLWNAVTKRQVNAPQRAPAADTVTAHGVPSPAPSVTFSPDGRLLAAGGPGSLVRLWDAATGRLIRSIVTAGPAGAVASIAFSPDGRLLATGGRDGRIRLWNVATGGQIDTPITSTLTTPIDAVAFSPNGRFLASGDSGGLVRLWVVATGRKLWSTAASNAGPVSSLAFSRASKFLASGDHDGTVRLWDIVTGQQIGASLIADPVSPVSTIALSSNGKALVSGNTDGVVRLWNLSSLTNIAATLCTVTRGYLTHVEWARYLPPGTAYRRLCP